MATDPRPLRVLFLPDFSASNPYQSELARGLERLGVQVFMARAPRRDPLPIIRAWVRHRRPDVVHLHWTHDYLGSGDSPGRLARARFLWQLRAIRALGTRLVWTVHNIGGHEGRRDPAELSVHRGLFALADAVICHCDAAVELVVDAYRLTLADRGRLHVIPHGNYIGAYPDVVYRDEARRRLDLAADSRVFLFIGGVRAYKGIEDLVSAFRELEGPDLRLLIAGNPRVRHGVEDLTPRLRLAAAADPRIRLMLRHVPDEEIQTVLNAADAVVLPFRSILTSGSAMLAMSFGRAVVAPRLGCLPEELGPDGSLLYDPDDPAGLGTAMRTALSSNLMELGARNREAALALDWDTIAVRTAGLYREPVCTTQ